MFIAARRQRLSCAVLAAREQTRLLNECANSCQPNWQRLSRNKIGCNIFRRGQNQLKIFAVTQSMVECTRWRWNLASASLRASQLLCNGENGNSAQFNNGAAAAGLAHPKKIKRQSVADVD